jgi:hypothetical protein
LIRAFEDLMCDSIGVVIKRRNPDGTRDFATLDWKPMGQATMKDGPTFAVSSEDVTALQTLVDSLYDCGIRPTAAKGSAGQLDATQRHLDDMRALVFKSGKP